MIPSFGLRVVRHPAAQHPMASLAAAASDSSSFGTAARGQATPTGEFLQSPDHLSELHRRFDPAYSRRSTPAVTLGISDGRRTTPTSTAGAGIPIEFLVETIAERVTEAVCERLAAHFPHLEEAGQDAAPAPCIPEHGEEGQGARTPPPPSPRKTRRSCRKRGGRSSGVEFGPHDHLRWSMAHLMQSLDDQFLYHNGLDSKPLVPASPTHSENSAHSSSVFSMKDQVLQRWITKAQAYDSAQRRSARGNKDANQPTDGTPGGACSVLPRSPVKAPALLADPGVHDAGSKGVLPDMSPASPYVFARPASRSASSTPPHSVVDLPHFVSLTSQQLMDMRVTQLTQEMIQFDGSGREDVSLGHQRALGSTQESLDVEMVESDRENRVDVASSGGTRVEFSSDSETETIGRTPSIGMAPRPAPLLFRVCGISPWRGEGEATVRFRGRWAERRMHALPRLYQWAVLMLISLATVAMVSIFAHTLIVEDHCPYAAQVFVSDLPLASCAVFGLLSLDITKVPGVSMQVQKLLESYTWQADKLEAWEAARRWDRNMVLSLWGCAVIVRILCSRMVRAAARWIIGSSEGATRLSEDADACNWWVDAVQVTSFALVSGVVVSTSCFLLYLCRSLTIMINHFCCRAVLNQESLNATHEWNVLQAVVRRSSGATGACLFTLMVACACAAPMLICDLFSMGSQRPPFPEVLPGILVTIAMTRTVFIAASINEKCASVPSLINACWVSHQSRERLVNYIIHSAAGYYVWGIKLTFANILRCAYLTGVIAASLATSQWSFGAQDGSG